MSGSNLCICPCPSSTVVNEERPNIITNLIPIDITRLNKTAPLPRGPSLPVPSASNLSQSGRAFLDKSQLTSMSEPTAISQVIPSPVRQPTLNPRSVLEINSPNILASAQSRELQPGQIIQLNQPMMNLNQSSQLPTVSQLAYMNPTTDVMISPPSAFVNRSLSQSAPLQQYVAIDPRTGQLTNLVQSAPIVGINPATGQPTLVQSAPLLMSQSTNIKKSPQQVVEDPTSSLGRKMDDYGPRIGDNKHATVNYLFEDHQDWLHINSCTILNRLYRDVLRSYSDASANFNNPLRQRSLSENAYIMIKRLILAIDSVQPLPIDIYVYRGIPDVLVPGLNELKIGSRHVDLAFASKSFKPDISLTYTFGNRCCFFMIRLPQGTKHIYLSSALDQS